MKPLRQYTTDSALVAPLYFAYTYMPSVVETFSIVDFVADRFCIRAIGNPVSSFSGEIDVFSR